MEYNPHISKHWIYQQREVELIADLKKEKFDLIVDLQKNIQSKKLCSALSVRSISFDKNNIRKWLFVNFKTPALPGTHIVDRYFDSLKSIDLKNDGLGLEFFIDPKIEEKMLNLDEDYICIALGAAHNTKQIPESILMKICDQVHAKIHLLGGVQDKEKGDRIAKGRKHVMNYAGGCSLHESALHIKNAKLLLTGDTGLMHIAVGLAVPSLVMWGNTVPDFGMYPYYGDKKIYTFNHQVEGLSCRPCSKLGKTSCPKGHFNCMNKQNIELIVEQIQSFIDV